MATSGRSVPSALSPSPNRTASRTWVRQYAAVVTSAPSASRPVTFETNGSLGGDSFTAPASRSNAARIGSTSGEWNACDTTSGLQRTPCSARARDAASTSAAAPDTTVCSGAFTAAIETFAWCGAIASATHASGANTAVIAPPAGSDCISRPRSAMSRAASSSDITPARYAAANSPTECPTTTLGATPQDRHSSASATSSAKSAGCVYCVSSSGVGAPGAGKITSSRGRGRRGASSAATRSRAARKTGALS